MNIHDTPSEQEQQVPSVVERNELPTPGENVLQQRRPVSTGPIQQPPRPQPPILEQPHVWAGYTSGTPAPWAWQPGPYTPYTARRPSPWTWIALTLLLVLLLAGAGIAVLFSVLGITSYTTSTTESRSFTIGASPTLVLTNDIGSVHVHAAAGNTITVQATKHASPGSNVNALQVNYAQDIEGNRITVTVERVNTTSFGLLSADFDVTVPATAALQLKTNTGSIDVGGVSGQMTLFSNTGSVQVSGGTLKDTTSLGTNTGSISFNGAITEQGNYSFTTDTGSVNVTLPAKSAFTLDAATNTGAINTNFPGIVVQHPQMTGATAHGTVGNSPQATVTLRTSTGSINLFEG